MRESFALLNNYYDKIYVLSVAAATERRKLFAERFEGLEYSFFFGADKNNFTIADAEQQGIFDEDLARKHHRFNKTMKPGEIACAWSHRLIYEETVKNNYSRILVFEDDAVPDKTQLLHLPAVINQIPSECELLMWGWEKNGHVPKEAFLKKTIYHIQHLIGHLKWNHRMISNMYAKPYSTHLKHAGFHDYTYAYGITLDAAVKLADMQKPVQYIADNLLAHASTNGKIKSFIVYPPMFLHDSLPGGIHRDSYIR